MSHMSRRNARIAAEPPQLERFYAIPWLCWIGAQNEGGLWTEIELVLFHIGQYLSGGGFSGGDGMWWVVSAGQLSAWE